MHKFAERDKVKRSPWFSHRDFFFFFEESLPHDVFFFCSFFSPSGEAHEWGECIGPSPSGTQGEAEHQCRPQVRDFLITADKGGRRGHQECRHSSVKEKKALRLTKTTKKNAKSHPFFFRLLARATGESQSPAIYTARNKKLYRSTRSEQRSPN